MNQTSDPSVAPRTPSAAMLITLISVATLAGVLVVLVFELTKPAIEANKREMIEKAVFQVIPGATQRRDFTLTDDGLVPGHDTAGIPIYAGYDDAGALQGIAAEGAAMGYADVIQLLYGYDPACECITGMSVVKMAETPGLGDKIITDPDFLANFDALDARVDASGDTLNNAIVTVKHGSKERPWQIDAISGATVSSVAVGKAINKSAQALIPQLQRHIGELRSAAPTP